MSKKVNNLELWESVEVSAPSAVKPVSHGAYKFSAIDAQHQIKRATELWGSYGSNWGLYDIEYTFPVQGMALVHATFKYPDGCFPISSSINFITTYKDGNKKTDDNFAKKIETDILTKALAKLGFNADVFMGKFDDNRYVEELKRNEIIHRKISKMKANSISERLKKIKMDEKTFLEKANYGLDVTFNKIEDIQERYLEIINKRLERAEMEAVPLFERITSTIAETDSLTRLNKVKEKVKNSLDKLTDDEQQKIEESLSVKTKMLSGE